MLGEQPSPDPVRDGRRLHEALRTPRLPHTAQECDPGVRSHAARLVRVPPQREDGGY